MCVKLTQGQSHCARIRALHAHHPPLLSHQKVRRKPLIEYDLRASVCHLWVTVRSSTGWANRDREGARGGV